MDIAGADPDRARKIQIVAYDPAWPGMFALQQAKIRSALGTAALLIEHVGSTSVPGLSAKPVIDVQLAVHDCADEGAYRAALEQAGYRLIVREPQWLRVSPQDIELYARTKQELARREWAHVQDYADAKQTVIAGILARAEAWRSSHA